MEWQQLEYFRVVAKLEHFRKSAEQLSISQPALSRSISKLEKELGVNLFDRTGHTVKLNRYGQLFLQRVERGLTEISLGIEEINQLKNPYTGTLSLCFLQTLGITILPEIMSKFNQQYPLVDIQLYQTKIDISLQMLLDREVDLCLISSFEEQPNITWQPLLTEKLYLYVPAHHRLANKSAVSLSELAGEPFIGFKKGLGMSNMIRGFFQKAGISPSIKFEGEDVPTLAGLVSAGLGITIIPAFHGVSSEKIKQISIIEPYCQRVIGLAWLTENSLSPSAALFRNYVLNMF